MKQLLHKMAECLAAVALRYGRHSTNIACHGPFCQPKVPDALRKEVS